MHKSSKTALVSTTSEDRIASPAPFWQQLKRMLRHPLAFIFTFTLVGLGLRLYRIGYRDYWDDEIISAMAARAPLAQIYNHISDYSIHPPMYYMLLSLWNTLGDDLVVLRLLSALISTACIPLVYILGRTLQIPAAVSIIAAGLFAFAPFHIFHGQQARMYPLLTLLIIATTIFFYHTWRHRRWWAWLGLLLCIGLGMHTHVYFPLSVAGLNVWLLWDAYQHRRLEWRRWAQLISAQAIGVAFFLPFLPQLLATTGSVVTSFWSGTISPFYGLIALVGLSNLSNEPFIGTPPWLNIFGTLATYMLLIPVFLISIRAIQRNPEERSHWLLLHSMIWLPILLATLISLTIKPILSIRYLTGTTPFLCLLIGWSLSQHWQHRLLQAASIVFLASSITTLTFVYPDQPNQSSLISMTEYLHEQQQPGDAIAYTDWQSFDANALLYPDQSDIFLIPGINVWTSADDWERRMRYVDWHEPDNVVPVREFAADYQRVWLALTSYSYDMQYYQETSQAWLEEHGELLETIEYPRGAVFLYQIKKP